MNKLVTVVIPVFEDWSRLDRCLAALEDQTLPVRDYEIIVVNNEPEKLVTVRDLPNLKLISCTIPGSYAARNAGVAASAGGVLAFTDSDCIPERDWLAQGLAALSGEHSNLLVAGAVRIVPDNPRKPTLAELYDMALGIPQDRHVRRGFAATANLFVPRDCFDLVGGFDTLRFSGGDADFCRRAVASGAKLVYCQSAVVEHPARKRIIDLVTKMRRLKGGQLLHGNWRRRLMYLAGTISPPVVAAWRVVRARSIGNMQKMQVITVLSVLWCVGLVEMVRLLLGGAAERR